MLRSRDANIPNGRATAARYLEFQQEPCPVRLRVTGWSPFDVRPAGIDELCHGRVNAGLDRGRSFAVTRNGAPVIDGIVRG